MNNKIAQVVVDLPVEGPFDYEIPSSLASGVALGHRVLVSFQTKTLIGYVVGLKATSAFKRLKPILEVLDKNPALSSSMLDLARDFAHDYCCSLGQAIATFLPAYFKKTKKAVEFSINDERCENKRQNQIVVVQDALFKYFWPLVVERMHKAIADNADVIVLVPENDRIAWVVEQLKSAGLDQPVAILDKQLKEKDQIADWVLVKEGKVKIVIGTRSAIFAPVVSLGLIVVLDENNFSYKQDQSPFYHARQVALMRAKQNNADLLFVVRSLSLELYYFLQKKKAQLFSIPLRDQVCLSQVIDMTNYKYGKSQLISIPLSHAIEKVLSAQGKILLVMNKKGFGSFGVCAKCQHILKCPRCDVPLTFLFETKEVVCRYCNHRAPYPTACPQCHGAYLHFSGMGIEKLESEIARRFPSARVQCYAKESETSPKDFDILIATQAVVRLDAQLCFDLTCVVQVDSELNRLDFQAGESAFSLLTHLQAMTKEKLLMQTHLRDNYCLKAVTQQNPTLFYKKELALRRELQFPPFTHIVEIVVRSTDQPSALGQAEFLFTTLNEKKIKGIEILPVQTLALARLRDQYRFVIVVKGKSRKALVGLIRQALAMIPRGSKTMTTVNVSP